MEAAGTLQDVREFLGLVNNVRTQSRSIGFSHCSHRLRFTEKQPALPSPRPLGPKGSFKPRLMDACFRATAFPARAGPLKTLHVRPVHA